ncbi:MAG: ABC transporter substrate-binding protein [Candidatus Tectimicrobiota bacterium]|nr:MAG: ABC transporter substrate-binding protein [Candidatus Tectomicrobia bacterium]
MMHARWLPRLACFTLLFLIAGCALWQAPPPAVKTASSRQAFTAAFAALPASLVPHGPPSWHQAQLLPLLFSGLTTLDEHWQPQPALATHWEVTADGLVYTLHLRQGVRFHHGKPLDAADVRHSFQQAAAGPLATAMPFAVIAGIDTPDAATVRFLLKEPYAPFLAKLTAIDCPIVPGDASYPLYAVPPGTGPFQLGRFRPGEALVLHRFADYWEAGLPRLERLELLAVASAAERWRRVQAGEVDFAVLDPLTAPSSASAGVVLEASAPTGVFALVFNTRRPPFADPEVRRAVAWAIDKAALAQQVLGAYGVPVAQPFAPEDNPWFVPLEARQRDLARARALLARAGYPQGLRVRLPVIAEAALFSKTALVLQQQLRQAGIEVHVEIVPEARVQEHVRQGTWELLLRGEASQVDPDDVYFAALHSSRLDSTNLSGYYHPELDALLSAGRRTLERRVRRDLYQQVALHVQREVPELYLFMARWPVAWRREVRGYDAALLRCCLLKSFTAIAQQGFKTMWRED